MSYNLEDRLEAFAGGKCSPGDFAQELSAVCDATPNGPWDVLSLVDQYYRRGKLSAELFRTIKAKIVPHVLGVRDSAVMPELNGTPAAAREAAIGETGAIAVAMEKRTAAPKEQLSEVVALQRELLQARGTVQRYRRRIAVLADIAHRARGSRAKTQRERAPLPVHPRRAWRVPLSLAAAVGSLLILAGVTAKRQQSPTNINRVNVPALAAAPAIIPQFVEPGQITLSSDRYVVSPRRSSATIHVRRTGGTGGDVSFVWWTQPSGAKPGKDYLGSAPKQVQIDKGVDSWELAVPILVNPRRKHTELFYVAIGKPGGGASLGSIRRAAVFIMPGDPLNLLTSKGRR